MGRKQLNRSGKAAKHQKNIKDKVEARRKYEKDFEDMINNLKDDEMYLMTYPDGTTGGLVTGKQYKTLCGIK